MPRIVARASRPLGRGHPARAFLAGAGRSRDSGRDARATSALSLLYRAPRSFCRRSFCFLCSPRPAMYNVGLQSCGVP